jgi:hypothetical protein
MIPLLVSHILPGRLRLQREQLLPGPRTDRYAIGDGMSDQIIQRASFTVTGQPRILNVAFDDAAALQQSTNARGDLLDQSLQLGPGRPWHMTEHGRGTVDRQVHAIGQNHVALSRVDGRDRAIAGSRRGAASTT